MAGKHDKQARAVALHHTPQNPKRGRQAWGRLLWPRFRGEGWAACTRARPTVKESCYMLTATCPQKDKMQAKKKEKGGPVGGSVDPQTPERGADTTVYSRMQPPPVQYWPERAHAAHCPAVSGSPISSRIDYLAPIYTSGAAFRKTGGWQERCTHLVLAAHIAVWPEIDTPDISRVHRCV